MNNSKKRDMLSGQKLISLPYSVRNNVIKPDPVLSRLYVSEIGYFPKAFSHFRERREGCPDNILIYCVRGRGWYKIKDKRYDLSPNEFVILPATKDSISYGSDKADPWTIYWVHFSGHDVDIFNRRFEIGVSHEPRRILFNEKGLQIWETMYQNLEMGYNNESLSNTNLCLYHFIATFLFSVKPGNEQKCDPEYMVGKVITYMRSKIDDLLTIEEMALKIDLSTSYFSSLFRKATGTSPMEYFIRLKLEKACLFLADSDMKIKNIAAMLGYQDPYHFSRLFKRHMNMSPDQYRNLKGNRSQSKPKGWFLKTPEPLPA